MTETKVRHPITGQPADIEEMYITDQQGTPREVLAMNLGSRVIYRKPQEVTVNAEGCTVETSEAQWHMPFAATLTPLSGHQQLPWNTRVLMGGVDITSTAYDASTNAISIPSVTGDIQIQAEAVEMSQEYEPVEYIRNVVTNNAKQAFDLGFRATEKTHIMLDAYFVSGTNLIYRMGGTSSTTPPLYLLRYVSSGFYFGYSSQYIRTTDSYANARGVFDLNRNMYSYNGKVKATSAEATFTVASNLSIIGSNVTSNNPTASVYRCKTWEDDVPMGDYVPCRRKSDGLVGLYNCINGVATIKDDTIYIAPFVTTTRSCTNCAATLVSAAITGTASNAVIGSTWQIKLTPTSGYTFAGGTTPQVEIDGVDVTSQVVADNGDGTYNITIANVEDKPIEITAVAVADANAVQGNLLAGSLTSTPDEPMGDYEEEEEEM